MVDPGGGQRVRTYIRAIDRDLSDEAASCCRLVFHPPTPRYIAHTLTEDTVITSEHRPSATPGLSGLGDDVRYRLLVDAVTDYAIYMLDTTGGIISWNPGAQRLKGYRPDEILGSNFSRFYTEEDRRSGVPVRALATALEHGRFNAEGWRVRKDGSRFWAHVVIDPVRSDTGELLGFAKVTRDLTERKAAEEALRQSEERFRLLVQGVTDYAIYMLDTEGVVSSWNSGAQRIKGYLPHEVIGTHFSRFYRPEDRDKGDPARALATAAREGRFEAEGWRVRKDGTHFWANVVIDPIHNDAGTVVGFAKITRDVTEKREAQRTLEQAREALMQAQKLDAIGQLTGGVAHDFNNLLMVILSSLALARKRLPDDDEKLKKLLDNAVSGARRGVSLTQRMLAFARRQELKPTAVHVPVLVHGMADMLTRTLGSTIELETDFPVKLAPVLADANQLELAVLNLAVNARDAMPEGGRLVISAREESLDERRESLVAGTYVCLCVVDTGTGMDDATLARAAEPFFTTKGVGKGTGLGLPMVHGLAAQSGGHFKLHSAPGQGTTAELWLPVANGDAAAPSSIGEDDGQADPQTASLRVLAVDDDALVLINTTAMLEELGHTVLQAASADDALEMLKRDSGISLLITDHVMPRMTGAQLIAEVEKTHPRLPTILATGYAELPARLPAGASRLNKPFDVRELGAAIDEVLRMKRIGHAP
jgi:PAS domain S-box-containing protein